MENPPWRITLSCSQFLSRKGHRKADHRRKKALDLDLFGLSKIVGTVLQDSDGQFIGLTVAEDIAFAPKNDCMPTEEMHREV